MMQQNLREGVMDTVNKGFQKARDFAAEFIPGGEILKNMTEMGMSDNETVQFFQNVGGPLGYPVGAIHKMVFGAKKGDQNATQQLDQLAQKAGPQIQAFLQKKMQQKGQSPTTQQGAQTGTTSMPSMNSMMTKTKTFG